MPAAAISIIVPTGDQHGGLEQLLEGYRQALERLERDWEIVLVPSPRAPASALGDGDRTRLTAPESGWGAAVKAGLSAGTGETLCYTNWRRTPPGVLVDMIELSLHNPRLVLRANRRTRDSRVDRLGSLLFNIECRLLLQIPAWDVNGTPKVFPRAYGELLQLKRRDGLFDAEFAAVCERNGYPVVEVPIDATVQSATVDRQSVGAALRMYAGVPGVARSRA